MKFFSYSFPICRGDRDRQDTDYVLRLFDNTISGARRRYREFVQKGVEQGRRPELSGGGLVRSAGGWLAVNMLRQARFRQKADMWAVGDVYQIIS